MSFEQSAYSCRYTARCPFRGKEAEVLPSFYVQEVCLLLETEVSTEGHP